MHCNILLEVTHVSFTLLSAGCFALLHIFMAFVVANNVVVLKKFDHFDWRSARPKANYFQQLKEDLCVSTQCPPNYGIPLCGR